MTITSVLLPFLVACLVTILATPISLIFIKKFGLFDDPKQHKHPGIVHTKPIPRGGGIPLFVGLFTAIIFFVPLSKVTIALLVAAFIALCIGVLDDKLDVSPYLRFFANIVVSGIVVGSKAIPQQITVIGSRADTLAYKGRVGYNVLDVADWSMKKNIKWLDGALRRGDAIRMVTDPSRWRMIHPESAYFQELKYLAWKLKGIIDYGQ